MAKAVGGLENAAGLSASVLSLPMHTELTEPLQSEVVAACKEFFAKFAL